MEGSRRSDRRSAGCERMGKGLGFGVVVWGLGFGVWSLGFGMTDPHDDAFGGGEAISDASRGCKEENSSSGVISSRGEKFLRGLGLVVSENCHNDGESLSSFNFGSKFFVGVDDLICGTRVLVDPRHDVLGDAAAVVPAQFGARLIETNGLEVRGWGCTLAACH